MNSPDEPDPDERNLPGPRGGDASPGQFTSDQLSRVTAPVELDNEENRKRWRLEELPGGRGPYMVELNVSHSGALVGAAYTFRQLFDEVFGDGADRQHNGGPPDPVRISRPYFRCVLSVQEWHRLLAEDEAQAKRQAERPADEVRFRTIYKLWPDFPVVAHINRSIMTIKADAALRSFEATGEGITWAAIDSGVDAEHPHFGTAADHALKDPRVVDLHRCFVPVDGAEPPDPDEEINGQLLSPKQRGDRIAQHRQAALRDEFGHGTHVAGIIAGRVAEKVPTVVLEKQERIALPDERDNLPKRVKFTREHVISEPREKARFHGVAPACRIVSLRVLDRTGDGRSSNIVRALEYIREKLNDNPKLLRVQGVNLSVGYEFDAEMFACGQSPLCTEVNRLVLSGVVVVTAAGNTGYTTISATAAKRVTKVGLSNTINDPGNAEHAITVGATHRDAPHTFGVSYFSSKGPTGDGRLKPDLVAPGERIVSCAAGKMMSDALANREAEGADEATSVTTAAQASDDGSSAASTGTAYYVEDSGTSMAAPHVSGAIAAFLSVRREFIGRPLDVKRIFLDSAIPLGRERYFEGHGLLDLMKAIQSV
jgi:subtilisin family serine protease